MQEKILSQKLIINNEKTYSLSCTLRDEGKYVRVVMSKLLYCRFVEEFDLLDRNLMVVNESDPLWDIDISKLSLHLANYVLKEKYRNYDKHSFHRRYKNKISKKILYQNETSDPDGSSITIKVSSRYIVGGVLSYNRCLYLCILKQ